MTQINTTVVETAVDAVAPDTNNIRSTNVESMVDALRLNTSNSRVTGVYVIVDAMVGTMVPSMFVIVDATTVAPPEPVYLPGFGTMVRNRKCHCIRLR